MLLLPNNNYTKRFINISLFFNQMLESKLVPQLPFESLDDFIKNSNNFYLFFVEGHFGEMYRKKEVYHRFKEQNPELDLQLQQKSIQMEQKYRENEQERYEEVINIIQKDTTSEIGQKYENAWKKCKPSIERRPWEELYQAYQQMSQLVYEDDKWVQRKEGIPEIIFLDNYFLTR